MKRCPQCGREYDSTMSFCLDDGSELLYGPANPAWTAAAPSTAVLPQLHEARTEKQFDPNDLTVVSTGQPINSIAVLPFAHLSRDPDNEYFCDGLAEELINALSRVEGLKVVARSSSFSLKGRNLDVSHVGSILNVNNVVEGSVRRSGDRMRINVQLTNTADGYNIWSEKYDTDIRDIFDVQDEIAASVVKALTTKLLSGGAVEAEVIARIEDLKHQSHEVEAYELYLRGRYLFNKFNERDLFKALDAFEQAIEKDPAFAAAHTGVADVYMWLTGLGALSPREGRPKAKAAALRAIELDPSLSDAHASLAIVSQQFDYDFRVAEIEYKRAIELNANNALAYQMYASLLAQLGRFDEAERLFEKSLSLDPVSPMGSWIYPYGLFLARRYDDCIDRARKILELNDNFAGAYLALSFAYHMRGEGGLCAENYARFLEMNGEPAVAQAARSGYESEGWDGFLRAMTDRSVRDAVTPYTAAAYFAALNETDAAIECLEDSFEEREGNMVMIKTDPRFDPIAQDPRFRRLVAAVGFS